MKETPLKLSKKEATIAKQKCYQGMTGLIMFFMVEIRSNIAFAISVISQFIKNPSHQHSKAMKTILQYLKTTRDIGITYGGEQGENLIIKRYFNSDWASDYAIKKLTSGYISIMFSMVETRPNIIFAISIIS